MRTLDNQNNSMTIDLSKNDLYDH